MLIKYKIENLLIEISKKEKLNYTILRYLMLQVQIKIIGLVLFPSLLRI